MTIDLETVILRRPEPEDVEQLYRCRNDRRIADSLGGFSTGYSKQDLAQWIETHRNRSDEVLYVIAERERNQCIGHAGLYAIDHRVRSAEFAILIGDSARWDKGIGSAVSRAMIDFGFGELNLHRIDLKVLQTNERAIRLYEKLGFRREGVLRDAQFRSRSFVNVIVMSILESEW